MFPTELILSRKENMYIQLSVATIASITESHSKAIEMTFTTLFYENEVHVFYCCATKVAIVNLSNEVYDQRYGLQVVIDKS